MYCSIYISKGLCRNTFTFVFAMVEWKLNILIPLEIKGIFLVENSNAQPKKFCKESTSLKNTAQFNCNSFSTLVIINKLHGLNYDYNLIIYIFYLLINSDIYTTNSTILFGISKSQHNHWMHLKLSFSTYFHFYNNSLKLFHFQLQTDKVCFCFDVLS